MADLNLPVALGAAASLSTFVGGLLALRFGKWTHLLLGLTAGIVLGVALFDLIPEALELGAQSYDVRTVLAVLGIGLAFYMIADRLLSGSELRSRLREQLGPASLTMHSFLDGVGIGLAFQISPGVGGIVAFAVLAHDLADGVNIVSLCLASSRQRDARRWLAANVSAPLLGVIATSFVHLTAPTLALVLALFAGFFFYIGACELLPRSYRASPNSWTTAATLAGMAAMYGALSRA